MDELKFALIGKDITHSQSKGVYQQLLSKTINYELIDVDKVENLPSLAFLQKKFRGVNITSPYKKAYLNQVELTVEAKKTGAINCLSFKYEKPLATNTDYLAIREFFIETHLQPFLCVILGDGVMANCTKIVLDEIGYSYLQYSRRSDGDITKIDLSGITSPSQVLIINCCSREYTFEGKIPSSAWFWDYNYNFLPHQTSQAFQSGIYLDGLALLKSQARHALKFWEL